VTGAPRQPRRLVYLGTPDVAVPPLRELHAAGFDIALVVTRPDKRRGRGGALMPSPVKATAIELGLPVSENVDDVLTTGAELGVVVAFGRIIKPHVLDAMPMVNLHFSLLPRWRGAAPVERAILAGDAETGVGIMQMEVGLDTGPVRLEGRTPIARKTAGELTTELAVMGAKLMVEVLADIDAHPPVSQPEHGVTYAAKIAKEELRLDFTQGAEAAERQIRAFNPPGAWFEIGSERIRVLAADVVEGIGKCGEVLDDHLTIACASAAIRPMSVQRAGRGVMSVDELLRGFAIPAGTRL